MNNRALLLLALVLAPGAAIATPPAADSDGPAVEFGGALRFNYAYKAWDEQSGDRLGDMTFDMFRLNVGVSHGPIDLVAAYRIYPDFHMLTKGYLSWAPAEWLELQVGLSQAPFAIQPLAANNWFFNIGYYLGVVNDHELGIKGIADLGPLELHLALYKNGEGAFTGTNPGAARFSWDVVGPLDSAGGGRTVMEINQANVKATYTLEGEDSSAELGLAGRAGQLYDLTREANDTHWAGEAHIRARYGGFSTQLMAIIYDYGRPEASDTVILAAENTAREVAAEGTVIYATLAYELPFDGRLLDKLIFYNDFSTLLKAQDDFHDTSMNVTGVMVMAHGIECAIELAQGRNNPVIGGADDSLAVGRADAPWRQRFNINLGFYY